MERLQKLMASRGVCSRRSAEEWIRAGRVSVNGRVAQLGDAADPERDAITIDGAPLPAEQKLVYLMLHKPRGYVTTLSDEKGRKTVRELVADCGCRVVPVGRLDMDSEGLLLLTNDGAFANTLMHPSHEVDKVYRVLVKGYSPEKLPRLSRPMVIDGYRIRPAKVQQRETKQDRAILEITIHEGRNRQVRKMCAQVGMEVLRLRRIAEGPVVLGDLPPGSWRYLTEEELRRLKKE